MNAEQCAASVSSGDRWGTSWQCARRAVVERDGKGYCKIHDPEYIAEKRRQRSEKWDAENREQARRRRLERAAPDLLAALRGVLAVADAMGAKDTDAIIRARAAIAKTEAL